MTETFIAVGLLCRVLAFVPQFAPPEEPPRVIRIDRDDGGPSILEMIQPGQSWEWTLPGKSGRVRASPGVIVRVSIGTDCH